MIKYVTLFGNRIEKVDIVRETATMVVRRTFGSWLAQAGVPIQQISALLRHSDVRVTASIYAHLSQDVLKDAVYVLDKQSDKRKTA